MCIQDSRSLALVVLIESDWNLKDERIWVQGEGAARINRIRLEFKEKYIIYPFHSVFGINRIRLEFKVFNHASIKLCEARINRIRLEFKEACHRITPRVLFPY